MHYLDAGWTIFIVSDHGLLLSENRATLLGDPFGVNISVMEELGYTVLKCDENGNKLKEIDWEKTTALAPRGNMIYLNLKGRNPIWHRRSARSICAGRKDHRRSL